MQHGAHQIVFAPQVEHDGHDVQQHQRQQNPLADVLVIVGRQADGGVGDKPRQRTREGDFVIAEQAGANLRQQEAQHGKHRPGADGAVPDAAFRLAFSLQVVDHAGRRINEGPKTRPASAHPTPDDAEQQQRQHRIAEAEVPDHGVAAQGAGDRQPDHRGDQCPVKKPCGQVPDAYSVDVLAHA